MSLARLHEIVDALPKASMEPVGQHHKIKVKRKTFAWHVTGERREALYCRVAKDQPAMLVAADPDRFFLPPQPAPKGYVGLWLDTEYVGWDEVRDLLTDAYRLTASKRLASRLPSA